MTQIRKGWQQVKRFYVALIFVLLPLAPALGCPTGANCVDGRYVNQIPAGVLKGSGGAFAPATHGTDYVNPTDPVDTNTVGGMALSTKLKVAPKKADDK